MFYILKYIFAGGKGSGFLRNTLEEEHTVREFVSFWSQVSQSILISRNLALITCF